MTNDDLDQINQRCLKATPGPWRSYIEGRDHDSGSSFIATSGQDIYLTGASQADQDFIASARHDVLALVAEVRRLRAAIADGS